MAKTSVQRWACSKMRGRLMFAAMGTREKVGGQGKMLDSAPSIQDIEIAKTHTEICGSCARYAEGQLRAAQRSRERAEKRQAALVATP